jgi:GTP cyclohydrolase IA
MLLATLVIQTTLDIVSFLETLLIERYWLNTRGLFMNVAVHHVSQREDNHSAKPGRAEAEVAFRTVLQWIGEDIDRDGLRETPARLVRAFEEYFSGYAQDPRQILHTTFKEIDGYDEMVVLREVPFESHCEHHLAPIIGRAWVAYVPDRRVVGISKLARVVEAFARRLQIQERLTAQIANTIDEVLKPQGVAVVIRATHHCMSTRGIRKQGSDLVTSRMLGCFRDNPMTRQEFLAMTQAGPERGQ